MWVKLVKSITLYIGLLFANKNRLRRLFNFTVAVIRYFFNGMKITTEKHYLRRLDICNDCEMRDNLVCTHKKCGCYLPKKARWLSEKCPLGKWKDIDIREIY